MNIIINHFVVKLKLFLGEMTLERVDWLIIFADTENKS